MADVEVHLDLDGQVLAVGLSRSNRVRGRETILFDYDDRWIELPDRFSLEPALRLTRRVFAPPAGVAIVGSIGDSAPDGWGRWLMQHTERQTAQRFQPEENSSPGLVDSGLSTGTSLLPRPTLQGNLDDSQQGGARCPIACQCRHSLRHGHDKTDQCSSIRLGR
jgi:hypothetical protein